jgi:hypothetical protein
MTPIRCNSLGSLHKSACNGSPPDFYTATVGSDIQYRDSRVSIGMIAYYLIAVFFFYYGIKCIALQHGNLIVGSHWVRRSFRLVPVHDAPAITAGLSYICIGLFWVFFPGKRARANWSGPVIMRVLLSVGFAVLWITLLIVAHKQQFGATW